MRNFFSDLMQHFTDTEGQRIMEVKKEPHDTKREMRGPIEALENRH